MKRRSRQEVDNIAYQVKTSVKAGATLKDALAEHSVAQGTYYSALKRMEKMKRVKPKNKPKMVEIVVPHHVGNVLAFFGTPSVIAELAKSLQ